MGIIRFSAFASVLVFAAQDLGAHELTTVAGDVWVAPAGGKEARAVKGQHLDAGAKIRTGKDGSAEIQLDNGSVLQVRPNSSMSLSANKRQLEKKSSVVLFFGRLWSKVTTSTTGETNFEVKTPNAVCGVRGTQFETAVGDDGSTRVRVSEGKVGVGDGEREEGVAANQEVEADDEGVDPTSASQGDGNWKQWEGQKRERLRTQGKSIVDRVKSRIMSKKEALEKLRKEQQQIEGQRKQAEQAARSGDAKAIDAIRKMNQRLAEIADDIADLGDETDSAFGAVDHFADLANDPRFKGIDRKYLVAEAASLRRIKGMLDKMVKEGTDMSIEAMDKMLDDMGNGQPTIRDQKGSSVKDLFGDEGGMDMH